MKNRSKTTVAALTFLLFSFSLAVGQKTGSGGTVTDKPKPAKPAEEPTQKTKAPVRVITKVEYRTPTTGSLSVSAEPGAKILVEPLNVKGAQEAKKVTLPEGQRGFIFNGLKPGVYRVAGTLAEHRSDEKTITISANKSDCCSITLNFERILYPVTINTNVDAGELKYGGEGETLKSLEFKNRAIQLNLPAGDYVVQISADTYGYEDAEQKFTVTGAKVIDLPLNRIVESTDTLAPTWTNAELRGWEMPVGWQADSKLMLLVRGRGVALPREARNRYYKDFRLDTNVRMTNRIAVSFALRARDSRNYYLLQITGENSDEPNFVRLFTVKNDVEQRLQTIPISRSKAAAMASGQFFNVLITVKGYEIAVDIVDSQTGAPYNLGVLTDRNFAVGAVGIVARGNEENLIEHFAVCTGKCMQSQ